MGNGMHACASGREREHILAKVTVGRALWALRRHSHRQLVQQLLGVAKRRMESDGADADE